ncbi:hypothetical protein NPIL_391381, partial [Nephila pilipes]
IRRSSHVDGRVLWEIPTSPTDFATADIVRCFTVGGERDALRFASRRLQMTFSSREGDAL